MSLPDYHLKKNKKKLFAVFIEDLTEDSGLKEIQ